MYILRLRRLSDDAFKLGGAYEFGFTTIPFGEDFGAGGAAENTRVDEAREAYVRDVSAGAEYAFEVPDGFRAAIGKSRSAWAVGNCRDESWDRSTRLGRFRQESLHRLSCRKRQ